VFSKKLFFRQEYFYFFKCLLLQKFVNIFIRSGKKIKSEKLILLYFKSMKKQFIAFLNPILIFFKAVELVKLPLTFVSRRKGRNIYLVPVPLFYDNQYFKALRNHKIIFDKKLKSKKFVLNLLQEHMNLLSNKNKSFLLNNKNYYINLVFENRGFSHFRWY